MAPSAWWACPQSLGLYQQGLELCFLTLVHTGSSRMLLKTDVWGPHPEILIWGGADRLGCVHEILSSFQMI